MTWINEKNKGILKLVIRILLILVVLYLVVTKMLLFFAPFLIAWLIASAIKKPVNWLQKKCRMSQGIATAVALVVFVVLVGGVTGFVFYRLFMEVYGLASSSLYFQNLLSRIQELIDLGGTWYAGLPLEVVNSIESSLENIFVRAGNTVTGWINSLLNAMVGVLTSLPQAILYTVITLVGAFFFCRDWDSISRFLYAQMPDKWYDRMRQIRNDLLSALVGYLKALLILVTISFFVVLTGYGILGVKYSLFLAILTAVSDILPVLGPGTVLIPGSLIYLINGKYYMAAGFIVLYILVTMIRQFLEPRIVGGNIGLHPLVTLLSMYLGFRLLGVIGLILGPIFTIILKSLQKSGILPAWKSC
ncbi:MAG TPA: sporulation integral membrane protein YtvI [Clostridiales bacterium]|nr:sporulation integral membrane protein YtvI [Clostridiales bacterium]